MYIYIPKLLRKITTQIKKATDINPVNLS
jgi:hypothetical protein